MKTISKIFAIVLALTMFMNVAVFAATETVVTGTNGNAIDVTFTFTLDEEGAEPIGEDGVNAGDWVYVWVNFAGNPVDDVANSIGAYDLLVTYDSSIFAIDATYSGLTTLNSENATFADGVALFAWANAKGIVKSKKLQAEGVLFGFDAEAQKDLTLAEINTFGLADTVTSGGQKQVTQFVAGDKTTFDITLPSTEEEFTPETIKGEAIEASATEVVLPKSEGSLNTNTYTNVAVFNAEVAEGISFSEAGFIWVKDTVETEFNYAFDGEAIKGEGSFEYGVVMAGIPSDVTITAIPYYVTAE